MILCDSVILPPSLLGFISACFSSSFPRIPFLTHVTFKIPEISSAKDPLSDLSQPVCAVISLVAILLLGRRTHSMTALQLIPCELNASLYIKLNKHLLEY